MRLAVRFVVPLRSARTVKDAVIRDIHSSLEEAGIEVLTTEVVQYAPEPWHPVTPQPPGRGSEPAPPEPAPDTMTDPDTMTGPDTLTGPDTVADADDDDTAR
jgi:hypothetical protein